MNPPYGRGIIDWVRKAFFETRIGGCEVVGLLPARTDTKWWHQYVMRAHTVMLCQGRIKFEVHGVPKDAAPFPSAIAYWRPGRVSTPAFEAWRR